MLLRPVTFWALLSAIANAFGTGGEDTTPADVTENIVTEDATTPVDEAENTVTEDTTTHTDEDDLGSAESLAAPGSLESLAAPSPWHQGGDKMWGSYTGIENVTPQNVWYFDKGMNEARNRCSDAGCALMMNPKCCRTVDHSHIHFVHYKDYGRNLKRTLESRVCHHAGWQSGGFPCGGTAIAVQGWPKVFSTAMHHTNIHGAMLLAWPRACGGSKTIIEVAYGCSIEHKVRGISGILA